MKAEVVAGAGEGNRTLVVSLEGFCSTIELHPPGLCPARDPAHFRFYPRRKIRWWRGKDSNLRRLSQQIYSLPPLTAREPLRTKPGIIWKFRFAVKQLPGSGTSHAEAARVVDGAPERKAVPGACRIRGKSSGYHRSASAAALLSSGTAHARPAAHEQRLPRDEPAVV